MSKLLDSSYDSDNYNSESNSLNFSPLLPEYNENQTESFDSSEANPLRLFLDEQEEEEEIKTPIAVLDDEDQHSEKEPPMKKQMIERPPKNQNEVFGSSMNVPSPSLIDFLRKKDTERTMNTSNSDSFPFVRTGPNSINLQNINTGLHGREETKSNQKTEPKIQFASESNNNSKAPMEFKPFPINPKIKTRNNNADNSNEKTNANKPEVVNLVSPEPKERARNLFAENISIGNSSRTKSSKIKRSHHPNFSNSNSRSSEELDPVRKQILEDEELARKLQRPEIATAPVDPDELLARQLEMEERNSRPNFRMRGFPGAFVSYQPEPPFLSNLTNDIDITRRFQSAEYGPRRRETPFHPQSFHSVLHSVVGARRGRGNPNVNPALLQLSLMGREFTDTDYEMLLKLDEAVENRKGAKKDTIENLPTFTIEKKDQVKDCCVCLSEMEMQSEVRKLPCGHYFHVECIDKWLELNKTCPIDKKEVN